MPISVKMLRLKRYLYLLFYFSIFAYTLVFIGTKMLQKNELKSEILKSEQKSYSQNLQGVISQSVEIAKDIMKKHNLVLFTLINNAYLPFVYSWLCNTINMGIHEQILFITTDAISKQQFEKDWPNVKVVVLPETSLNGNQTYSKVGYVKLMVKRTEILNSLLQNDIEILLFEVDCLWVSNPIDECKKIALENDVIVTCIAGRKRSIAGGFIYMKPTNAVKTLWQELNSKMRRLGKEIDGKDDNKLISKSKNDQVFFTGLIQKRFGGIKYEVLPWDRYIDGKWYEMKLEDRQKKHVVIINNNWVAGNAKKLKRAKKFGHWFIDDSMKCKMDQVDRIVYRGLYV
ncbi:Hypothetical predicted protein [Octopus vulgaris]|uniref:Nucleotide-diphospho-sugar transferase domain-containing protein n=1 Tax=Octopus vulgaris TaxID=6645 RepID=A0AA36FHD2_OCTVU|nr:Hypothetical predicted protein [Octopus vulgaris]